MKLKKTKEKKTKEQKKKEKEDKKIERAKEKAEKKEKRKRHKQYFSVQGALREERMKDWEVNETKHQDVEGEGCKFFNGVKYLLQDRIRFYLSPQHKNAHNRTLNHYAGVFVFLYVGITIWWLIRYECVAFFDIEDIFTWNMYISIMLLTAVIHVWRYAVSKNIKSVETLEQIFPGDNIYQSKVLPKLKKLVWPLPFTKGCTKLENFLKALYLILYLGLIAVIIFSCINLNLFGFGQEADTIEKLLIKVIVVVLFTIGIVQNYFSYYVSIVFCYITREIANSGIECDQDNPWNSRYLRDLVHISSRSSMSFLAVSMMYLLAVVVSILPGIKEGNRYSQILILGASVFLCGISYAVVTLLPKLFLNRLFRTWKIDRIKALESKVAITEGDAKKYYEDTITKIWASNMPYVRMEIATTFITFAIDISSLIVCILQLTKQG